jgi:hypothetical protein
LIRVNLLAITPTQTLPTKTKTIQNKKKGGGGGLRFEDLETFSMNVGFHAKIEVGVKSYM